MAYGIVNVGPGKSLEAYTEEELEGILDAFATEDEVDTLLKSYVTSEALDNALGDYVTSEVLSGTLENYVLSSVYEEESEEISGTLTALQKNWSTLENTVEGISAEVGEISAEASSAYVNLVDYDVVEGGYLESDGSMGSSDGWTVTDYMPVTGGDTYTVILNSAIAGKIYVAWYDSDQAYLYTTAVSDSAEEKEAGYEKEVTAPSDAAYARADWGTDDRDALGFWGWVSDTEIVERYESSLSITAYGISSRVEAVEETTVTEDDLTTAVKSEVSSQIDQLADSITAEVSESLSETICQYVNLVDYEEAEGGYLESDGSVGSNDSWTITDYMSVTGGDTYTVILNSAIAGKIYVAWYDSEQEYLYTTAVSDSAEEKESGYEQDVSAPSGAAYARADWGTDDRDALGFWGWVSDTDVVEMYQSSLCITAHGITSRVEAIEGDYATSSDLTQLADSITASVQETISETGQYVNLVDYNEVEAGYLTDEGEQAGNGSWSVTDYMSVTGGDTYTVILNSALAAKIYVCWYDKNRDFLYTTAVSSDTEEKAAGYEKDADAPDDAAYARMDWGSSDQEVLGFWGYTTDPEAIETYESSLSITAHGISSRVEAIEETAVTEDDLTTAVASEVSSQVEQLADSITAEVKEQLSDTTCQYVNLVDYDEVEAGYLSDEGEQESNGSWSVTGYMAVTGGDTYTVILNSALAAKIYVSWYDENKGFLYTTAVSSSAAEKEAGYEKDITAPDDAAYARADWGNSNQEALGLWGWVSDSDTIEKYESSLSITAHGISSRVEAIEGDYATSSEISQLADSITLSVSNSTDSAKITLKAGDDNTQTATISMSGLVTFTDLETEGSTTINGANIKTGTLSADKITTGTLSADRISGGTIDAENVEITNLSADSITSGTIDATTVTITNLDADNINSGTLSADYISGGSLDASNINLYSAFTVYNSSGSTKYGTLGYMTGKDDSGTTYGIGLKNADGESYIIVTGSGARFTSGDYSFYITNTGHFEVDCEELYVNNEKVTFD